MSSCLSDEEVLAFAIGRLPAARQAEAHVHLDQCDTCQHLLSEAAHALATAATLPLQDSERVILTTMFRPGMLVAQRYMIRRFIARGGMGEVYEAFDQDMQQRVALKTVTSTASDSSTAVRKLKEEVALARRVSHTNVCRIYDLGRHVVAETGAKVSFLTMELVEGETLGQRIRLGGALPVAEARKLARELLEGLKAAHDSGVLHRDFKSDNVMLCNEGDDGTKPLILDFGLARQLDRDNAHSRSSHGAMLGTYGYIAPELVDRPHSKASDVYAFGIVWFEMLTGELPFASSSSSKILTLDSEELNAPAPSAINPSVPRTLDNIVLGCLRRSPKDRYRTAGEALAALDEMEAQEIAAARLKRLIPRMVAGVIAVLALLRGDAPAL
jgi:eukaryotic-like serine/threonine-protein kinase